MRPIEIIAECGINHQGNMELANAMILWAKRSGADTAKFQYYDPEAILDPEDPVLKPWWDTILKTKLTPENIVFLKETCDKVGIKFLCSVFDHADVPLFEEIGVERYKIASRSIYDWQLAEAIAKTRKPVLVSWGHHEWGRGWPKIWNTPRSGLVKKYNLYCVSKYPTPLTDLEFFEEDKPTDRRWSIFEAGRFYGFSDHTQGLAAAAMAMAHGARIIEKHFTLDRTMDGPDHAGSADAPMLAALCRLRDGMEEILYK